MAQDWTSIYLITLKKRKYHDAYAAPYSNFPKQGSNCCLNITRWHTFQLSIAQDEGLLVHISQGIIVVSGWQIETITLSITNT